MSDPVAILLVDDQPQNLDVLEAILGDADYRLVRAQSADTALLALMDDEFAAIVLDIRMPGMSGLELASMIKQRKRTQHIPLLFLTAHLLDESDMLKGYGVGAVDYLTKPFNPEILRSKIAGFAQLFRATRAQAEANLALSAEVAKREQVEEQLRTANDQLESRVRERTAELLRVNQALRDSQARSESYAREAEAANKAKDHFLAILSHELRTPLTPVLLSVQLLEGRPWLDAETRESLATIRRNIELEARLIDDLLDLTRVSRGSMRLNAQPVDLGPLLRQAIDICSSQARAKGIAVTWTPPSDAMMVHGDPARLQQVFWNVIGNAVKFTPERGQVTIACWKEPGDDSERHVFEVRDTGSGIGPEFLPSIFDAFTQGDRPGLKTDASGLGLGLAISKALTEMHGGRIEAHSEGRGKGATFRVSLPALRAKATETSTAAKALEPAASKLNILLVEDHEDSARVLTLLLGTAGHRVTHAATLQTARSVVETQTFDLIISDLGLPDGSGHELMREVGRRGDTPGIALSGYGMDSDLAVSQEAGFVEHLTKPVELQQLLTAIKRAVSPRVPVAGR